MQESKLESMERQSIGKSNKGVWPTMHENHHGLQEEERERNVHPLWRERERVSGLHEHMRVMGENPQAWINGWSSLHVKLECLCVWR